MSEESPMIAHGRPVPMLHNATLPDGRVVDVRLADGRVWDVVPGMGRLPVGDELDLTGHLLLTAPAEPHAHLDKALSFDEIRPPMGDLGAAITAWENHTPSLTVEGVAERARRAALLLLGNGTTAVRSHVNLLRGDDPLRGIRALVRVRDELAGVMDIQLVALAPYFADEEVVHAALDLGVDFVGGHPHQTPDPSGNLQRLLAIARARNVGVDMHTDEQLNPMMLTLEELAHSVRDWPESMPVTAGHCVSLGMVQPDVLDRVIRAVKASDIGIVSLPITNLYLQGWGDPVATPRGLTAIRALLDVGVRVAGGGDNVRDPYNPLGRSDALETAMLLVTAGHLTVGEAYHAVSDGARDVMGLAAAGVGMGLVADLLAIRSSSLEEAVATAPQDRIVLRQARLVSVSRTNRSCAVTRSARLGPTATPRSS
ncbi:amidohydrolase family protein [Mycobacterium sp. 21AC1]|uniref:amidohydrolase family protein n=1 Tax=[Mycobacterium] appelbergii TaxID=2939269 RepID=UPI002938F99B|nr:amidohydrolase family protein [Mycobacterium sp. 21AC1]MDV3126967.1 amidohydrolase family protein [Mycobacterium sp. 21AC1]